MKIDVGSPNMKSMQSAGKADAGAEQEEVKGAKETVQRCSLVLGVLDDVWILFLKDWLHGGVKVMVLWVLETVNLVDVIMEQCYEEVDQLNSRLFFFLFFFFFASANAIMIAYLI